MFISHNYKLLFLEVPRTGSRSISRALAELDPESPTAIEMVEGPGAKGYHAFRSPLLADPEYRVIATHRNPYERLWSFWKHRRNTGNPDVFKTIEWSSYIDWACDPSAVPELAGTLRDLPISEMFDLDRVDFWLDFNTLRQSWEHLALQLGIPLVPLHFVNASPDHGSLSNAYNESTARRVAERFAEDFEYFGYDLNSWKVRPVPAEDPATGANSEPVISPPTSHKPRVAILTTFAKRLTAFSLQRVVQDQLAMLTRHGYEPMLLVLESDYWAEPEENFADERVEIVQYPEVKWNSPEDEEEVFLEDIEKLRTALEDPLSRADVVFTHDVIYHPAYLKLAIACRQLAQQLPDLKWLHWIHSATAPHLLPKEGMAEILYDDVLAQKWPGSYPVFFNRMSIPRIANNFHYGEADIKVVPHPTDVCRFLGLGPLATRLYEEKRLYLADYISIVPVRLDRGKQIEWVVRVLACLKALGECVRIIVMDFHSQGDDKKAYREELKEIAAEWGLDAEELTFMSEFDDSTRIEASHGLVRELFSVANLYIQPSRSESYSLTCQEAAMCGNLLVLNDDFPPFREMFGDQALYFQFSSNIDRIRLQDGDTHLQIEPVQFPFHPSEYPGGQVLRTEEGEWRVSGEAAHAHYIANRIRYEFMNDKVLGQRQIRLRDRNLYSVFSRYLEPLILTVCG